MKKTIICIGREYGSGGHAIGQILAKRTGYEFYDKDRFIAIAKERGFEGEVEEYLEEQPMNSLLYSIALNYSRPKKKPFPFELVEELAAEKPCIIIGRCAGYLTHGQDNAFSVFVHADMEKRIATVMARDTFLHIRMNEYAECGYGETYRNRYGTRSYQYSIKGQTQD